MTPDYKVEFPEFDDELPTIPGMEDSSWHNEAMPTLANNVAGFRLWVDYKDPGKSELADARVAGEAHRYSLSKIHDPEDIGKDETLVETDDLGAVLAAYAKGWMQWVAVHIGQGFHPDTSSEQYEPALDPQLAAQYDEMIELTHEHLEDPYAVGLEAWFEAGVVERPTPSA